MPDVPLENFSVSPKKMYQRGPRRVPQSNCHHAWGPFAGCMFKTSKGRHRPGLAKESDWWGLPCDLPQSCMGLMAGCTPVNLSSHPLVMGTGRRLEGDSGWHPGQAVVLRGGPDIGSSWWRLLQISVFPSEWEALALAGQVNQRRVPWAQLLSLLGPSHGSTF